MDDMPEPRHARPRGWKTLRRCLIGGAVVLSPAFFIVMFQTVTALVRPSFGIWAWTVPVATEGCFLLLYGLDILLEWARKPKGWLRWTPYPFAAASLLLNVWAYQHSLPGMLGHGVITVAFFLPVIAAESAVRDLAVTDEEVALAAESAAALRHARDVARDRRGVLWRWRVPSLLRVQILRARPPAAVADAVREGAQSGGAVKWEQPVEQWVVKGLTRGVKVAADVEAEKRQIARQAQASGAAPVTAPPKPRQRSRQKRAAPDPGAVAAARDLVRANPRMGTADVVAQSGASKSTVLRLKREARELPRALRPVREATGE
jgi:hypothetical protein